MARIVDSAILSRDRAGLLVNVGLLFAPAAHGGALFPGVMPLMVAILAAAILKEPFTPPKTVGPALIVIGAIGIGWITGGAIGTTQNWPCPLPCRRFRLGLLHRRHAPRPPRWPACSCHCRRRVAQKHRSRGTEWKISGAFAVTARTARR